jgi:hypothetical protein
MPPTIVPVIEEKTYQNPATEVRIHVIEKSVNVEAKEEICAFTKVILDCLYILVSHLA